MGEKRDCDEDIPVLLKKQKTERRLDMVVYFFRIGFHHTLSSTPSFRWGFYNLTDEQMRIFREADDGVAGIQRKKDALVIAGLLAPEIAGHQYEGNASGWDARDHVVHFKNIQKDWCWNMNDSDETREPLSEHVSISWDNDDFCDANQ